MIQFSQLSSGDVVCLKQNNDGSTTRIAVCYKEDQQNHVWQFVPGRLPNTVIEISMAQLIEAAYLAYRNVAVFDDLFVNHLAAMKIKEERP